ncbi:MAG: extracellular solute-binding protein, partial [Chloroflexota bacterium]
MPARNLTRRGLLGSVTAASGVVFAGACGLPPAAGPAAQPTKFATPQTVEFWGPDPKVTAAMNVVLDTFNAQYSPLDVVWAGASLGISPASQEKFIGAIIAGTPPDVAYTDRYIPRSYAVLDAFLPLDDRIRKSPVKPEDWWPYLRRDVTQAGKLYGLPTYTDARVFAWNKEYFRDLGLDQEKPPATWDDITAIATRMLVRGSDGKLARAGFFPWGGGFHTGGLSFFLHLWQAGGETLTADERKPRFQEPPGVKALDWMMTVGRQIGGTAGYKELTTGMEGGPGRDAFSLGRLGMQLHNVTVFRTYVLNMPQLRFGIAEIPIPVGGQPSSYTGGHAVCMPKNTRHPDAAWAFMTHWLGDEMQFAFADQLSAVPAVRRIAESDAFIKADPVAQHKLRETANKAVRNARWVPTRPGASELLDVQIPLLTRAGELQMAAKDLLDEMARQTQLVLDKWYEKY